MELRVFDPADSSDTYVALFYLVSGGGPGVGNKMLIPFEDKLLVTIPSKKIWEMDVNNNLTLIYDQDANKSSIETDAAAYLEQGGIVNDNKVWWGNLVYDGTTFYNWIKAGSDAAGNFFPLFVEQNGRIWGTDTGAQNKTWQVNIGSSYKGTAGENYLIFNNFDKVSGIDKLAVSVTVLCKTLASGQKITVEYTTGELTSSTSWTTLGTLDYSVDGAITQKVLYFGDSVTFKKIWFKYSLEAGGSDTPSVYDHVMAYLPYPDFKLRWLFTVKCFDDINRKDGTKETKPGLQLRNLLRNAWLTKSVLTFEDYDAASEIQLNGALTAAATTVTVSPDTDIFPESGRILIDSEEIFYTGKTKKTFTGCTRGARGTNATTHSDAATVSMAYRTVIRNYREALQIANDPTKAEYEVSLEISEI